MSNNKSSKIALGGICLALTVIFMFAGTFVPGIELTLFAVSSLFTAVMIIEADVRSAVILYIAAVLLGFAVIPNKAAIIPFAFLFGYYGILKYYIEKLRGGVLQVAVKTVFFAVILCAGLLGFKELLLVGIHLPDYPVWILILGGTVMLLLYDYIYTLLINFYLKRIKNRKSDDIKLS